MICNQCCRATCWASADRSGTVPLSEKATSIFSQVSSQMLLSLYPDKTRSCATTQYSQVTQGNRPVKNAEVTATIEGVGGNSHTFELWDNGAGADLIANDGVYSRFFFTTDNDTFYTVSCLARSSGSAEVLEGLVNQGRNSTDLKILLDVIFQNQASTHILQ